jgi:hypothetical protein
MIAVLPTYRPTMRMSGSRVSYTACVARVAIGEEGRDVSTQLGHIITLVVMEAEDGRGRARGHAAQAEMALRHEVGAHPVHGVDIHPLVHEAFEGGEVALLRRLEQCHLGHCLRRQNSHPLS